MSWIYGASGGTNFWEEQIKNEKRLKKTWSDKFGVEVSSKRAAELQAEAVDVVELKPPFATPSQATAELAKHTLESPPLPHACGVRG